MKHLLTTLALVLALMSCSTTYRTIYINTPEKRFDAEQILYQTRPELVPYYEAGVLKITSMREYKQETAPRYELETKFVRHYLRSYEEKIKCLQEHFPDMYNLYINGYIDVHSIYRFVDSRGNIRYNVNYFRVYDYYYYYIPFMYPYGGYRYDYMPRPLPRQTPRPPKPHHNQPTPRRR